MGIESYRKSLKQYLRHKSAVLHFGIGTPPNLLTQSSANVVIWSQIKVWLEVPHKS